MKLGGMLKGSGKFAFLSLGFIKKHWYWLIFLAVLAPSIITTIRFSVETQNPSYPLFLLATRILNADLILNQDTNQLREDPSILIGMEKPEEGIWLNVKYGWKLWWNVIYKIMGNVYLIFFPFILIYKIIRMRNISEPAKNTMNAAKYYLLFLFVTNTIILIHGVIKGNRLIVFPEGLSVWKEYFYLFVQVLPFHGLGNLLLLLVQTLAGV